MKKLLKKIDLLLVEVNVFIFVLFDVPKSTGYLQMTVTFSLVIIWERGACRLLFQFWYNHIETFSQIVLNKVASGFFSP